jgi:hypothetical protein
MGVRVKVRLACQETGKGAVTAALLNAGYETEKPECIVPARLASELDVWPELPKGVRVKSYETAGGPVKMYSLPEGVEAYVITHEGESAKCLCNLVISEIEREVLLSDAAIEALNIVIESPLKGLWRFKGSSKLYESEKPEYW